MKPSSRTPEGESHRCPVCGKSVVICPSRPPGDAPCPNCGCLIWFPPGRVNEDEFGFRRLSIASRSIHNKVDAIMAMIDQLIEDGAIDRSDRSEVLAAIMKREELGSTGIGHGVAVPHGRHSNLRDMICAIAELPRGVDFEALDGEPVQTICMILSPSDKPGDHLRALEAIARRFR